MLTQPLIDRTFFIREINLPNIGDVGSKINDAALEKLNSFIQKYEPECLRLILGNALYALLLGETSQRMSDLIGGVNYVGYYNYDLRWRGLVNSTTKESLIADYIYYFYKEATATLTTGTSTKVADSEGGKSISPYDKMVNAWNSFSRQTDDLRQYLWYSDNYPEYTNVDYWKAMKATQRINMFGI